MKIRFIAAFLLILPGIISAQEEMKQLTEAEKNHYLQTEKLKKTQYPGDSNIDVTYYKLQLRIPEQRQAVVGTATIGIKSTTDGLGSFFLDLRDKLSVNSVTLNGQPLNFTHPGNQVNITLPRAFNKGEGFSVTIDYGGYLGWTLSNWKRFGYMDTTFEGQRCIYTLTEPFMTPDWFPCKDTPGDKADSSEVWVTCPTSMKVASNGTLQEDIDNGNGTHLVKWKNHYPIAQYLISIAVSNYVVYTNYFKYSPTDSLPIINYIFPKYFVPGTSLYVKPDLDKVPAMLRIYSNRFGPYPFLKEKFGQAQILFGSFMENQTMTSMINFSELVVAHELAHHWFGDKVTCSDWHHSWLNEGFAQYAPSVYYEDQYGKSKYNANIKNDMELAKNSKGSIYVKDDFNFYEIFASEKIYSKGAVVLHMLRGIVGDSTFFKILREYNGDPKYAYGVATIPDFEEVAERVYGQSLKYFFDEWIYGENYPSYYFGWTSKYFALNFYDVSIDIQQKQNSNPAFFTMPVKIKISTEAKDTTITLFNNAQKQNFRIRVSGRPKTVTLDPDNLILRDFLLTGVDEKNSSISNFRLEQNYPNPFNPGTKIRFHVPDNKTSSAAFSRVTLKVFDVLGREVLTLFDDFKSAGENEIDFDASKYELDSGIYYYQLRAGNYTEARKMVYLK